MSKNYNTQLQSNNTSLQVILDTINELPIYAKFVTENEDGMVSVFCVGQVPTNDYTI